MRPTVTVILDPYSEYRRPRDAAMPFEKTLRALLDQTYPADLTRILLTAVAAEVPLVEPLVASEPRVRIVAAPEGSGYYQKKNLGALRADSDIVLLADGDCLYPPEWIAEMVAAFERGGDAVAAVQGTSRFAPGSLAQILNPVYWRAFEREGPLRQIYSAHNLGLRRSDLPELLFEDTPLRAGLERELSSRIRKAGRLIWHNRRVTVLHDGEATFRELWQQAVGRGYYRMILWRRHPNSLDRRLRPLGYLSIPIYVLFLFGRDSTRQVRDLSARGLTGPSLLKLPGYVLFTYLFHVMSAVGMFRVLRHLGRTGRLPSPEVAGASHGSDLGVRLPVPPNATKPDAQESEPEAREPVAV
jgi:glycosyltransferase involved in cell wall biosynthesis